MFVRVPQVLAIAVAVAAVLDGVYGHAQMQKPMPNADGGVYNNNSPAGTISGPKVLPSGDYNYNQGPEKNYETFTAAFKAAKTAGKYKSLKDLVDAPGNNKPSGGATTECGFSKPEGTPQALPDKVHWEGFKGSPSHLGPCEVWCDDVLAFQDDNCVKNFAEGDLPYDKSKCEGKKRMRAIWLALHVDEWQVYPYCATLDGKGGGGGGGSTDTKTTPAKEEPAPAPAPKETPAPEPKAPAPAPKKKEEPAEESPSPEPAPIKIVKKLPPKKKKKKHCRVRSNLRRLLVTDRDANSDSVPN